MTGFLLDRPGVHLGVRAMVALIVAFFALGVSGLLEADVRTELQRNLGMLVILISTALCVARPVAVAHERPAWACIAAFLVCNALGAAYYSAFLAELPTRPAPTPVDLFWFLRYVFLLAGIHLLIRTRTRGFTAAQWVDGATGVAALIAVSGILVIEPVLDHVDDPVARGVFIAYPVANVLAVGFLIGVVVIKGLRRANWAALGGSLVCFILFDGAYDRHLAITGKAPYGGLLDLLVPCCAFLLAVAAWQRVEPESDDVVPQAGAAFVPLVFAVLSLTLLAVKELRDLNAFVFVGAMAALAGVLVRQVLFAQENRRILARVSHESVTDALTGLPNRRALLDDLRRRIERVDEEDFALALMDLDGFKGYNDRFGHQAGDELLVRLAGKLQAAVDGYGRAYRLGGDEFCVLTAPGRDHAGVAGRAAAALREEGTGFEISCSYGFVLVPEETRDSMEVLRIADARMYADKGEGRRVRRHDELTALLSAVLRERHPGLEDHTDGVTAWAVRVGDRLGVTADALEEIRLGATLHDVGKMAVPDAIIDKAGPLNEPEWEFMRRHAVIGERILQSAHELAPVSHVARWHHERWDGSGYPDGLAGEEIPLAARIVAVCDAFQAMIDDRPYRRGRSVPEAVEELRRCAGSQFDPVIVDAFIAVTSEPGVPDELPRAVLARD